LSNGFFQFLAARRATFLLALIWIATPVAGTYAGGPLADLEDTKANDANASRPFQLFGDPGHQVGLRVTVVAFLPSLALLVVDGFRKLRGSGAERFDVRLPTPFCL
jgi:hypothetical protein